ncbi:MAG TPA: CocE/NonD family hydrolase [Xanthobacteraceae bacterium]|nr:CocE/NonD family hydrolase [Xanthobacteraceae bacterium]
MIVTTFPRPVRVIEHTLIPLRDGTTLAARIWLPEDAEQNPVPAILEYLPYRKRDGTYDRDSLTHPYLAGHGYAGVRVDLRGSGESEGLLFDEYAQQEQDDALEVIAWLAAQPWCSGVVGMMGISWGGFNGLQIAARRPAALKAIVTICSTDDRYADDAHYMGGTLLTAGLEWGFFFFALICLPPDPVLVGYRWRAMWLERLENVPLFFETWLRHQRRDAYWKHASVCEDYAAIQCPVYAVGGWTDGYTNAVPRLLAGLKVPRKGLIGPWAHAYPHFARPGPQIGFLQEMLRWWDYWLKGIDTGVMDEPMLRVWMADSVKPASRHETLPGRWVAEPSWPSPAITLRSLFLTDAGLREEAATFTPRAMCSPQTVGSCAGEWVPFGRGDDQAGDQGEDDARSLVFDTAPLETPIEMLGAAIATLEVVSDRPMANLGVRLCDLQPGGESLRVSYGVLNLTHRDGHESPALLAVGQRYRVRIQLNDAGAVFPAGHRIRLALSTAYWPIVWPCPEKTTLTILAGTLELPVRPPRATDARLKPLPGPETAAPEKPTVSRRGELRIERIDRIGLESGSKVATRFHIEDDDPLSAVAELRRTDTKSREGWQVRIETQMRLACTRDVFLLQASLRAWEGENEVCRRDWERAIARDFL